MPPSALDALDFGMLLQGDIASELIKIEQSIANDSFREYVSLAWPTLEPATTFVGGWHIDCICEHLQAISEGKIRRVIFNVPPGAMKSLLVSVLWPTWHWTRHPADRFLTASYSDTLSLRDALKSRRLIQSDWYQSRWGHCYQLMPDQNQKSRYENNKTGYRIATHVGGATGERAKIRILDDPHNIEDVESAERRKSTIDWVRHTWSQRESDAKTSADVVVMQRLHQQDVSGYLLDEVGGFEHVMIPMRYEPGRKFVTVIGTDPRTVEGELLAPARWDQDAVTLREKQLGSMATAGQLQQRPAPQGGGLFKKKDFRYYTKHDDLFALRRGDTVKHVSLTTCLVFQTVDLAASEKTTADYTVVSTWALTQEKDLLWLECLRDRLEGPDQPKVIAQQYHKHKPSYIGVERIGYQLTLIQTLRRQGFPVKELTPDKDKIARAMVAAVLYEGGQIYHPIEASWLHAAESELLLFPNDTHDDIVDTVAYAARQLVKPPGGVSAVKMTGW